MFRNISSRFSSNSEAKASELLENLEEMCSRTLEWSITKIDKFAK